MHASEVSYQQKVCYIYIVNKITIEAALTFFMSSLVVIAQLNDRIR